LLVHERVWYPFLQVGDKRDAGQRCLVLEQIDDVAGDAVGIDLKALPQSMAF